MPLSKDPFATSTAESASPLHVYDYRQDDNDDVCDRVAHSLRRMDAQAVAIDPRATCGCAQAAYRAMATCPALVWC